MAELKKTSRGTGLNLKENNFGDGSKTHSPTHSLIPTLVAKKARQPLTPIQKPVLSVDNDMVKVKKTGDTNGNDEGCSKTNLTQIKKSKSGKVKSKTEEKAHRQDGKASSSKIIAQENKPNVKVSEPKIKTFSNQEVQTENPDLNLVTGDATPPDYYEQLAETRRVALDDTLKENQDLWEENEKLQEKIKTLEKQNDMLLQWVDQEKLKKFYDSLNEMEILVDGNKVPEDDEVWKTIARLKSPDKK